MVKEEKSAVKRSPGSLMINPETGGWEHTHFTLSHSQKGEADGQLLSWNWPKSLCLSGDLSREPRLELLINVCWPRSLVSESFWADGPTVTGRGVSYRYHRESLACNSRSRIWHTLLVLNLLLLAQCNGANSNQIFMVFEDQVTPQLDLLSSKNVTVPKLMTVAAVHNLRNQAAEQASLGNTYKTLLQKKNQTNQKTNQNT